MGTPLGRITRVSYLLKRDTHITILYTFLQLRAVGERARRALEATGRGREADSV